MENRTVIDLEFDKVLNGIKKYALSTEGRDNITPSLFTSDSDVLEKRYLKIDSLINRLQGETALEAFPSISHLSFYLNYFYNSILKSVPFFNVLKRITVKNITLHEAQILLI